MHEKIFDVLIVGAGPIGIACGIEAKKRNFSHIIIEKGCLVNSIFHYPTNMTFFSTSDRLEVGDVPFISHGNKPTRHEALEYFRRVVDSWKLNVRTYESVYDIQKFNEKYKITSDQNVYFAHHIIIATGFYDNPNLMGVPGENLLKVRHYYSEPHPYAYQKVAVIGAGNSAVDAALETFRRGAAVTMVIRESEFPATIKYWVKPDIENRIKEGSIVAYFDSTVKAIRETEIDIQTPAKLITLENDFVLAMTGYHPDYSFLKKIGIDISADAFCLPCYDPDCHQTNIKNIFLAGVVCGGMETGKWTIENSKDHPQKIFDYLQKNFDSNSSDYAPTKTILMSMF